MPTFEQFIISKRQIMNERGDITMTSILLTLALSSLLILYAIEASIQFKVFKKRTKIFLCAKKVSKISKEYLSNISKSNWVILNAKNVQQVSIIFPVFAQISGGAEKIKSLAKKHQDVQLLYLKSKIVKLKDEGCSIESNFETGPYYNNSIFHQRNLKETTILRGHRWSFNLQENPFKIFLSFNINQKFSPNPKIEYMTKESLGKFQYIWQSYF